MGTKSTDTCLKKAAPDEPIFVLRAQDVHSPAVIRFWCAKMINAGAKPDSDKIVEAMATAHRMEHWPKRKQPD
jgi:hypothetical protein